MRSVFLVTTLNVLIVITQNDYYIDTLFTTCYNMEYYHFLLLLYSKRLSHQCHHTEHQTTITHNEIFNVSQYMHCYNLELQLRTSPVKFTVTFFLLLRIIHNTECYTTVIHNKFFNCHEYMVCYHLESTIKNATEKESIHSFKCAHYPMRMFLPLNGVFSAAPI